MTRERKVYALAASRGDFEPMRARLESATGARFLLVKSRSELSADFLEKHGISRIFLPHWSHIIPASVYEKHECVIFHMTDLPFGRGGSPLQNLIARGIYETKISALRCVKELDAGPIYMKAPLDLKGSAEQILSRAYSIIEIMIADLININPPAIPQDGPVTVFRRRVPENSRLDGCSSPRELYDRIRMLDADGYPHAFFETESFRVEFTRASLSADSVSAEARLTPKPRSPDAK